MAFVVAAFVVIAACGSGDGSDSGSTNAADADPQGVLRYSYNLTGPASNTFDLAGRDAPSTTLLASLVFDTLLHELPDGSYKPGLAEKADIVDERTIDVTLHPGMKFTDGSPVDAEAARFTLLRLRDSASGKKNAPDFSALLGDVQVVSPVKFRILLTDAAAARFYEFLGRQETTIVSPTAVRAGTDLNQKPVGAGPFTLVERVENQRYVFKKNPGYWDADGVRLGGVEIVHIDNAAARISALRSGQVDMVEITTVDVQSLEADYGVVSVNTGDSVIWGLICKSKPPLDDPRVRQALIYATNREDLNLGAASGLGAPMDSLFPEGHRLADAEIAKQFKYDPKKATTLLQQAGVAPGTEIVTYIRAGEPAGQKVAEILQQQWAKVGINLRIVPSQDVVADYFSGARQPLLTYATKSSALNKLTRIFTSNSIGNVCRYQDDQLTKLAAAISAAGSTTPEGIKLWKDVQQRIWDLGFIIPGIFQPIVWSFNDEKLGDVNLRVATTEFPEWSTIYVKKQG